MRFTTGKYFLDTNFLVYLFDEDQTVKRDRCKAILKEGLGKAVFALSTQVLKEFASVMISKYQADPLKVKDVVRELSRLEIIQVNAELIHSAIDHHILYGYSFWDSLIIASALKGNCSVLITEDLRHNQVITGLRIINPFI